MWSFSFIFTGKFGPRVLRTRDRICENKAFNHSRERKIWKLFEEISHKELRWIRWDIAEGVDEADQCQLQDHSQLTL